MYAGSYIHGLLSSANDTGEQNERDQVKFVLFVKTGK